MVLGDLDVAGLEGTAGAITAKGGTALAVAGDLTDEGPAARLIDAAVARFGRIDILVNNVGGSRNAKIWEMKADDWDFVLRLNLRSTFLCTRAAVPHMMRQRLRPDRLHVVRSPRGHAVDRVLPGRLRLLRGQGRRPRLRPGRGARARPSTVSMSTPWRPAPSTPSASGPVCAA